jgi:hypothetical protein
MTVNFNNLITGPPIQYDDNAEAGWYVNGSKVYNKPDGFTDAPAVTTVYTLRFTTNGTLHVYSLTVTVHEPPNLVVPNDVTICSGASVPLNATVTNATALTEILWTYDGFIFNNGMLLSPTSTGGHTVTATADNTPNTSLCPQVSKPLHITVNFNPKLAKGEPSTVTHCTQETINLNDCIDFFVYDTHANNEKQPAGHTGAITWYTTAFAPVSDPEHVLLTSLTDTAFYADLGGITVHYSTACDPSFQQGVAPPNPLRVPINITSNYLVLDYGYNTMCRGDSVYTTVRLLDNNLNPSPCDTIKELNIPSGHVPEREIRDSGTQKILVFAPFTDLYDTIKINAKGNLAGVEQDFRLFLRNPAPPVISPDTVCINTNAYFRVIADRCDTIYEVDCPTINESLWVQTPHQWTLLVPDLPNTTSFQCKVTYFSKLKEDTLEALVNSTLRVWNDPPKLSVYSLYNNTILPFDNATQNLCLGDSLLFVFSTPHNCDTITDIPWTQNNGTFRRRDKHVWEAIVKPGLEGNIPYSARVTYKHPKGMIFLYENISYTISVKQRPRLFVHNPPDTLKYCYPTGAPLDLNLPPSNAIIDYNFVASGAQAVNFLVPKGSGVDTLSSFAPDKSGDYVVEASYKYLCSEIDTLLARGQVHVVVNREDEAGASFIVTPDKGFCELEGITIRSVDKEGSSLAWEHNGTPVTFPYQPGAPGTYTLTTLIYNACFPQSNPKRHDVNVRLVPVPKIQVMPDTTVCSGDSIVLKVLPGFVGDTLIWTYTTGMTAKDTITISNTTSFRGVAHNTDGVCGDTYDEVTIFRMQDASLRLMPDTSACRYHEIRLRVTQKDGDEIIWRSSNFSLIGTGENVTIWVDGNETYTAIISNRCSRDSADLRVTSLYLPKIELKIDTSVCYGESLDLNSRIFDSWGSLQWMPNESTSNTITEPTMYIATVTTPEPRCGSATDTMYVNVYQPLMLLPDDSNLPHYNAQDFYDVSLQTLHGAPNLTYSISGTLPPGLMMTNGRLHGQLTLGPTDYNTHQLQVSVIDGHYCKTEKDYILAPEWKAPNVLLPMGDIGNAIFLPDYNLEVYNRNGLLMHEGMGWDGLWNNAFVPAGTYFYKVKILIDGMPGERMSYVVVMYY